MLAGSGLEAVLRVGGTIITGWWHLAFAIEGLAEGLADGFVHGKEILVVATKPDGTEDRFTATVRIDTPQEIRYYQHGGILPYVLRQLLAESKPA